jgi:hypothetical protein
VPTSGRGAVRFASVSETTTSRQAAAATLGLLSAKWQFPERPLVLISLDARPVAGVDYLEASASAHWFVRWAEDPRGGPPPPELALVSLATQVPEEVDANESLRVLVLDTAIKAAADQLHVDLASAPA